MQIAPDSTSTASTQQNRHRVQPRTDLRSELLVKVRDKRCEQSFRTLFEYYWPRVRVYLHQRGASERISQEAAQEVMIKVWTKADQFDATRANASTWIFTIARNLLIDCLRQEKRSEIDVNDPLLVVADPMSTEEQVVRRDDQQKLAWATSNLPSEQAEVLKLVYMQGKKQREIAEALGIPLNTVKSRLRLALERLRKSMEHC